MNKFNVGDKVAITPETSKKMALHCHPLEIPVSNHGTVESVIRAKADNHPYAGDLFLVEQDMITVDLDGETVEFPARDLMLLY